METDILHQRENSEWSEQFLKSNGKKFGDDCITVLRLLYKGMRLTAKNVNDLTGMADGGRRLRDIFKWKKECCKGVRRNATGGLEGVEYWLEIPKPFTKKEVIAKANEALINLRVAESNLVTVFELDENPPAKPSYTAQTLFP